MKHNAKAVAIVVVVGIPVVFHMLFRTCGQYVYGGCRRSFFGSFLVEQGGVFAEIVRSTEYLFSVVVGLIFVAYLLSDAWDRVRG
ncbi:hypothetical protein [Halorubrum distributum]|uniref:Uncharacterized protein n=1 Tax=Halorubrum distributum JCM 10247 TaxID=1227486 RepID=M0DJR0_9EURY|nr:hypothetical protein [Halorubrum terrestre]ELZ35741.1 hypothetical protein C473_03429 [Halorubrum terrestre JCM 10247]